MAYQEVADALEALAPFHGYGANQTTLCPAHDDTRDSLSLKEGDDGRALVYCHAGCEPKDIMESLGLSMSDLFVTSQGSVVVDTYTYVDEDSSPLIRVTRTHPKGFWQERWEDGEWKPGVRETRRVLYRLPGVLSAVAAGETIYWVEGEKDADNLVGMGYTATTMLGGAGKWRDEYSEGLAGARVMLVPDADDPGRLGAARVQEGLLRAGASVEVRVSRVGNDVTDHLLAGYGVEDLVPESSGLDEFGPLDWSTYEAPETEWLLEPYVPKGGRVLAFGPAGSLKSLWAMWVAAHIAREGGKVAYFSLEMLPSDTAKRMKSLNPPKENFVCFTKGLKLGSSEHTAKLIAGLQGYDLIVIDSWTAARAGRYDGNEEVAELDRETLLPIINNTGATVLILDNTGHDAITDDGRIHMDHARGASAKGDKMEVTVWFRRPFEDNNYRATLTVKKVRIDFPIPLPVTIETPQDRIEFYKVVDGERTDHPMWPGLNIPMSDPGMESAPSAGNGDSSTDTVLTEPDDNVTPFERRAQARLRDSYGAI